MYRYRTSVNGEMEPDEDGRWVRFEDHLVALVMKDAEIAQWKAAHAEMARRNALGERVRSYDAIVQQLVEKDHRLDELMARAVSIAEMATSFSVTEYPVMVLEALVFLDSPKVIAWRKKQEEQ
mgnify:CR=1 FL=1